MYVCSNCGTAFEGNVCPGCCTMRPAAAVLGNTGRILRNRDAMSVPPQRQAEELARELEGARLADRQRKQHADAVRQRAAQLAQAAQRQEERRENYARQAQKAANWQRKAPLSRADLPEETNVERPDALRHLKIGSAVQLPPTEPASSGEAAAAVTAQEKKTDGQVGFARRPSYPAAAQIPDRKKKDSAGAQVRSDRLDAAWRYLADGIGNNGGE